MGRLTGATTDDRKLANESEEEKEKRKLQKKLEELNPYIEEEQALRKEMQKKIGELDRVIENRILAEQKRAKTEQHEAIVKEIEESRKKPEEISIGGQIKPFSRDSFHRKPKKPPECKGTLTFKRAVRYESEDVRHPYLIRRKVNGELGISTLERDQFVRGRVVTDKFGEPSRIYLTGRGIRITHYFDIKLTGELFTKSQKRQFKAEIRSKIIAELQKKLEKVEGELASTKIELENQKQTNEELSRQYANCVNSKLKNRIKKLVKSN